MFTITNIKCLPEESTCAIRIMVIQHLVYAKILIFSTVVPKSIERIWQFSPRRPKRIPFLTSYKSQG